MFLRKLGLFFLILILTLSSSCTLSMRTHGTTTTGKQSIGVSSAKDITAFLIDESIGVINGTNITVTLPFGTTDLKALVPTITTTGTNVSPASGIAEDFTNPRTYRVTAADGSTKDYRVTVTVSASSDKDILVFTLPNQIGSTVIANTSSTTGAIAVTVPYGTSVANLVASFSTTGISVAIGSTPQVSGVTANNFTSTKAYTVTAADGSTKTYKVTVTTAASNDKNITSFTVSNQVGSTVIRDISSTQGTIAVIVPYGTALVNLVATFSTTGVSVAIGNVPQVSGVTTNSFTSPQTYTVTAADGSTKNYIVTATIAASSDKNITSFTVPNQTGSTGIADISSTEGTIAITVPHGTDVTKLVATFSTTGASVAISGTPQISGITSNNFTNPKTYTVTAEDGTTKTYIVTVAIAVSSDKNITAFTFPNQVGASVITDTSSTQGTITAKATYGTDLTKLIATFTITGLSVSIGSTPQVSGTTINNFTSSQTYTVTAEDGSTKSYLVTVTVETTPVITSFTFPNTQRGTTVLRSVITNTSATEGTIDVQVVFYTTDFTKLIADFTTAGASVTVGGVPQVSGVTPNNFTNPITYTVTASDGKTRNYRVTITVSKNIVSTIDTSTVKGVVVYQGSPNQYLQNVIPGSVTIDAIRASDTSNATCFITSFPLSDASTGATIKVVKYPANGDISNFETAKPYANEPIANNDFFLIKVIAEESVSVGSDYYRYYYKIVVTVTPKSERVIGDCYQGGKIIYILQPDDPGYSKETQHGLIVSSSDQSGSASWGCYTKILSGADGTAIGTGSKNTDNIISGCSTDGIAAKLARAYDGGGYKDWYLPSKDELNKIYLNKSVMDNAYCLYYWSSSESDVNYLAWIQMFDKDYADPAGTQRYENKNSTMCCVRAVRSY